MMIRSVLESERKKHAVFAVLNLDLTLFIWQLKRRRTNMEFSWRDP